MSLDLMPIEIIEQFRLDIEDVISLQRLCRGMYMLIKERVPRIFSRVIFRKEMEFWIPGLMNVRLKNIKTASFFLEFTPSTSPIHTSEMFLYLVA